MSDLKTTPSRFSNSRHLTWFCVILAALEIVLVAFKTSPELAQVLTLAIPAQLALAGAWSGITNWAEVRK